MEGSLEWVEGAGCVVGMLMVWGMTVGAHWLSPELREVRRLSIQHQGEVTSVASFARSTLEDVTGRSSFRGEDPVVTLLGMVAEPEQWQAQPLLWVPSRSVRKTLGLSVDTTHTALNDAALSERLARLVPPIIEKRRRGGLLTQFEHEVLRVYGRLLTLKALFEEGLYLVPPPSDATHRWRPILRPDGYPPEQQAALKRAWAVFLSSLREGRPEEIQSASQRLAAVLENLKHPSPAPRIPRWRTRLKAPALPMAWGVRWVLGEHVRAAHLGPSRLPMAWGVRRALEEPRVSFAR